MITTRFLGAAAICLATAPAFALDQGEYRFNAFGTLGLTYLGGEEDGRSYGIQGQTTDSWRGDELSKLGGQLQYGLTDKFDVTAQVLVKAEQDSWKANLEWLYLSHQTTDRLVLRAGRLRNPVYMYSETLDVGFTYPWIRLPDEVYHQVQISNYEGADFIYTLPLSYGSVSFQANGGKALNRDYFLYDAQAEMDYRKIAGGSVTLATNNYGSVRLSYSEASLTLDNGILDGEKGKFTSLGYQYDNGTWLTANEATRLVVEGPVATKNAFYLMGGRRFGDFLPHLTYAQLDERNEGRQTSWTAGLNYSLLPNVTLKGEYKRVDTKGGGEGVFVKSLPEYTAEQRAAFIAGLFGRTFTPPTFDGDIISVGVDFVF
jgi:hypothetical protein